MKDKGFLDEIAGAVTALLNNAIGQLGWGRANKAVLGPFTWTDLCTVGIFILFVLLVHALSAALLHRKTKNAKADSKEMKHHLLGALSKPFYLLIWVYGIYLAAGPLLLKLPPNEQADVRWFFNRLFDLGIFAVLFWLFFRFTYVLDAHLAAWASKSKTKLDDLLVPLVGKSFRIIVPVVGVILALPVLHLSPEYAGVLSKGSGIILIISVAFILFQSVNTGEQFVIAKYDIHAADNLQARKIYTQVHVISKTLYVIIVLFALASMLMLFEEVRRLGASILASAGIASVVLGFAAQKTIANLFAGLQIALAQPIRLDDVLIVEGEWGRVEEITLTYVVIHVWDETRLVVPLSYFIEKPFQNWTRTSAGLLGQVHVWMDYSLPLDEIRKALKDIIEPHPLWDKRFWNLQVSEATEKTMQIRVLATAADSSKAWDLRCSIREHLIVYVQKHYPQCLPQFRASLIGSKILEPFQ